MDTFSVLARFIYRTWKATSSLNNYFFERSATCHPSIGSDAWKRWCGSFVSILMRRSCPSSTVGLFKNKKLDPYLFWQSIKDSSNSEHPYVTFHHNKKGFNDTMFYDKISIAKWLWVRTSTYSSIGSILRACSKSTQKFCLSFICQNKYAYLDRKND